MNKKDLILNATLKLVNRQGFYHLNMKQLADEAGISAGTTYLYFKSKEELINELYRVISNDFSTNVLKGYIKERSFKENFFEMLTIVINYYLNNPDRFSFIEQYTYSPFLFKETKEENWAVLEPIQKIIKKARKEKLVKNLPETLLVALSYGPVISMLRLFIVGKADLKKETIKKELINACWQSISD